jgi:taurine dioxygenase
MPTLSQIHAEPISSELGVTLTGFEFEEVAETEAFFEEVSRQLRHHLLVYMPGQHIEAGTLTQFASQFGPLLDIRRKANSAVHVPGHDLIKVISNIVDDQGRHLGDGNTSAQIWHSDSTTWEVPVGYIGFYCRVTPPAEPKTSFLNMIEAYRLLPEWLKERINNLHVVHHVYDRQIEVAIADEGGSLPVEERSRGFVHPIVRRHIQTNRPCLYLPTRHDSLVIGLSEADSLALLDELWDFVGSLDCKAGIALQPDDFVIWDNTATVHSREGWPESEGRQMWHISMEGERPTPLYGVRAPNTIGMNPDQRREALANLPTLVTT